MSCIKIWKKMAADALEGEYRVFAGKGERSIVRHVESAESSLLGYCLLLF